MNSRRSRLISSTRVVLTACCIGGLLAATAVRAQADGKGVGAPAGYDTIATSLEFDRFRGGCGDMAPQAAALLAAAESSSDPQRSFSLVRLAVQAAPDDPHPHAALLGASLRQGSSIASLLDQLWEVVRTTARDPWFLAVSGLRVGATVAVAALLSSIALLICALPRVGTCLLHDFTDAFPKRLRRFTPLAFLCLMTAAFLTAGVGPLTMVCGVALALLPYVGSRLRWTLGLSVTLALAAWGGMNWFSRVGDEPGKSAWAYYRVYKGDAGPDLENVLSRSPGAQSPSFLLARAAVARRAGRYDAAGGLLVAAIRAGADEGVARVELGNLSFLRGQFREAEVEYGRAAVASPRDAIPWVNLHVLYLRRVELVEADKALESARSLNAAVVDRFQREMRGGKGSLLPLSTPLESRPIFEALWLPTDVRASSWPDALSESLFFALGAVRPGYLAGIALLVTLFAGLGSWDRRSHRCPSCGAIVCPRCSRRIKGEHACGACWSLATQKGVEIAEKDRQRGLVEAWRRRNQSLERVLLAVSPGWSRFADNGSIAGLLIGFVWALSAASVLLGLVYPVFGLLWMGQMAGWLPWLLVLACHGHGLRRALTGQRARAGR